METIEENGLTVRRWQKGPSTYVARPELGARLMSWNLKTRGHADRSVIHWPEDADNDRFAKVRGGNPILFPFSARTFNNGKIGEWKDQNGVVRPMPQHGFTRDGTFEIINSDESGFTAALKPTDEAHQAYPFKYRFTVQYIFEELSFKVILRLRNDDETPILWSAGHHFYFTLPWHPELERGDYEFNIPAKKCFRHQSDGRLQALPKGWESEKSFGNPEVSDRIYSKLNGHKATFGPAGGEEQIGIEILDEPDTRATWNAFVVWTEKPDSPFFCVEPWMGPPNSPEHKKGLHAVSPGTESAFSVEVSLL